MWHGSQRWEGKPEVRAHKRGHAEAGAGIYTTTSYETARKYAKGGGAVIRFELEPDIRWLEEARISPAEIVAFVHAERGMKKRKEIIADIERVAARTPGRDISAATIVNLMVNHEAIAGTPGQSLAAFLVAHGIDASHDRRGNEDWVVIFNPAKIRSTKVIAAKDIAVADYDLPRIQRGSKGHP